MFTHKKSYLLILILLGILLAGIILFFWINNQLSSKPQQAPTQYGITFSTTYAKELGLDVKETYRALVEDLGVRAVRLPVYWTEIEPSKGGYQFEELDWIIDFSKQNNVKLTLVVGTKVPRWPECYIPDWAQNNDKTNSQTPALSMIQTVVERYKDSSAVVRWQVENEPFFPYGKCAQMSIPEFQERVDLVRKLDSSRPIQITVSGEFGPWKTEAATADVLGISMYRLVWNDLFGYFLYPISPEYYYVRAQLVEKDVQEVIVSELQAEPWFNESRQNRSLEQWYRSFDAEMFKNNIQFVEDAHLPEVYLWGAEWWYLLKINGDSRLWDVASHVMPIIVP